MNDNYKYQETVAKDVLNQVLTDKYIAGVVGACPGAGKTTISHIVICDYVRMFPNSRVLVLTHNMNVLKNQYLTDLLTSHVPLNFSFGSFRTNAQVRVGIPASIRTLDWESIDLLVVDEAHEYWAESMVTDIYKKLNPKHVVLLTGSPSSFTLHNKAVDVQYKNHKKYYINYISGSDLAQNDVFSPVSLDSVTGSGSTKENLHKALERAKFKGYDTSKMLIACKTIDQANIVSYNMKELGRKVALSTSEDDSDSEKFEAFLKGDKDVLVVVKRGVLGFSDVNLTLVIDMRCSSNLDVRFQLMARVLRKSPKGIRKTYLSVPSNSKACKEVDMLKRMIKFMDKGEFQQYIG